VYTLREGLSDADFLLYNIHDPSTFGHGTNRGEEARQNGTYVEVETREGLVLLKRAPAKPTEPAPVVAPPAKPSEAPAPPAAK